MRTDGRYLLYAEKSLSRKVWTAKCFDLKLKKCTLPKFSFDYFGRIVREYDPIRDFCPRLDISQFGGFCYFLTDEYQHSGRCDQDHYYCSRFPASDVHSKDLGTQDSGLHHNPLPPRLQIVRMKRPNLGKPSRNLSTDPPTLKLHQDESTGMLVIVDLQ